MLNCAENCVMGAGGLCRMVCGRSCCVRSQDDGAGRGAGMEAAWLSPGTGSSWGRVADLGKAVVLASAISLLGVEAGSDIAVCEDLWELLEDADGE